MSIREYKPVTPALRGRSVLDYKKLIDKVEPLKSLLKIKKNKAGRNNQGKITVRHKGGGNKRFYRILDFKRDKRNIPAKVEYIEYDPNRTAFIARLLYKDGERKYIIAPEGLKKGDTVISSENADLKPGNALPLANIPVGTFVHNVELYPGKGGQIAKGAGTYCQIMGAIGNYIQLRLPSGEVRKFLKRCYATVGQVSNIEQINLSYGKAGRMRWLGIRPTVRGVVMNPVDHPHGGGEGKTSGGGHPQTPWAVPTKGFKTRKKKKQTDKFIIRRRNAKNT